MFISAVSTKGPDAVLANDNANICDLTPASFRVDFDEPIRVKNCDFELVSCKVTKRNVIVITAGQTTFAFRMGDYDLAEQYVAKIQTGTYSPAGLAQAIQDAIDEVMPVNFYKGTLTTSLDGLNRIIVTYTIPGVVPPPTNFTGHAIQDINSLERGVPYQKTLDGDFLRYECSDAQKAENTNPFRVPSAVWETCGGNDIGGIPFGRQSVDKADSLTRVAVDSFGIWEGRRGGVEAVLRPVQSCIESTFDKGYNGFTGTTGKPTYFTFEFERNVDSLGNEILGEYRFGGMFNSKTYRHNYPVSYNDPNKFYINGFVNVPTPSPDQRGAPYNITHRMFSPYSRKLAAFSRRELLYDTGWSGLVQFRTTSGPSNTRPIVPGTYAFQMKDMVSPPVTSGNRMAVCIAKRDNAERDRVKIRATERPLITGLPQTLVAGGPVQDTLCTIVPPISPASQDVKYKVGSIGQLNSTLFGIGTIQYSTQCLHPPPTIEHRYPYYKIVSVNPDGSPGRVVLCDSGEYVNIYDPTDADNTSLFLNDPDTFEYLGTDPEDQLMQEQIHRITPTANDIGAGSTPAAPLLQQARPRPRYASFNMGLMRDNIFDMCRLGQTLSPVYYGASNNALQVDKDIEIDVYTVMENPDGTARPAEDTIAVIIKQLQPATDRDDDNRRIGDQADVKQILFNASSGQWLSSTGPGLPALTNWTTFVGAGSPIGAIKVTIGNNSMYDEYVSISHNLNYVGTPNVWQEPQVLTKTNITRGGAGGVQKNVCTRRTRFFPLHPVYSPLPCTIFDKNIVRIRSIGTVYPLRNTQYRATQSAVVNLMSNYFANEAFMATGQFQAPQNAKPDPVDTDGDRPTIMIKTQKLEHLDIVPGPAPVADGSCILQDFSPSDVGSLYNAGLHSVMYAKAVAPATTVDFGVSGIPITQPFMPSFTVEIQNLPLRGYIGKNYDDGVFSQRRGLGSRLPIVGVVPAEQFTTERGAPLINYYYKTPYSQPCQVRLPSETFLYSLDINLRNIITGQLLKDLVHNSEVVLRMYPLPDDI